MDARTLKSNEHDHVTTHRFVDAMAASAMGVCIVTTQGPAGKFGLTVSAWSSVSAEPPVVLVCINRKNLLVEAVVQNGRFAVNVLTEAQSRLARIFAGRPASGKAYDFSAAQWHAAPSGDVLLDQASATFSCALDHWHDVGTHRVFMGRVESVGSSDAAPLLYHNRTFGRFEPLT